MVRSTALRQSADSKGVEEAWFYEKPEHGCENHAEEPNQG
jgi:hypothetical protein